MEVSEIVPDVFDFIPKNNLTVKFANKEFTLGEILTIEQVKDEPFVTWKAEQNKFYTLCFTDPDAPSREKPEVREWLHWLVVNIPGNEISKGQTLTEFVPSSPGEGTGLHRYTFVVYEQSKEMKFDEPSLILNRTAQHRPLRRHFRIKNFAKKYNFQEIPHAATFFQTQYDDYVPILKKQMGLT